MPMANGLSSGLSLKCYKGALDKKATSHMTLHACHYVLAICLCVCAYAVQDSSYAANLVMPVQHAECMYKYVYSYMHTASSIAQSTVRPEQAMTDAAVPKQAMTKAAVPKHAMTKTAGNA